MNEPNADNKDWPGQLRYLAHQLAHASTRYGKAHALGGPLHANTLRAEGERDGHVEAIDSLLTAIAEDRIESNSSEEGPTLEEYRAGYEAWKTSGRAMHQALLEIWRMASTGDTAHLTYGESPRVVVDTVSTALNGPALGKEHRALLKEARRWPNTDPSDPAKPSRAPGVIISDLLGAIDMPAEPQLPPAAEVATIIEQFIDGMRAGRRLYPDVYATELAALIVESTREVDTAPTSADKIDATARVLLRSRFGYDDSHVEWHREHQTKVWSRALVDAGTSLIAAGAAEMPSLPTSLERFHGSYPDMGELWHTSCSDHPEYGVCAEREVADASIRAHLTDFHQDLVVMRGDLALAIEGAEA